MYSVFNTQSKQIMIRFFLFGALLMLSLPALTQTVVAYREAPLMGAGPYFLNGTAIIEEFDNGMFQFRLNSAYSTNTGPDVQIYLTNNGMFGTPVDLNGTLFVEDIGTGAGGISHFSGPYSKFLTSLTSLSQFDHVVFVCVQFGNLHWGDGSFGNTVTVCNTTTSSLTATSCDTYTAPSGAVFNSSGTYQDTIPNAGGCDSVITLNLTINQVDASATGNGNTLTANMANASYQWIDCNNGNSPISGASNQDYTPTASGSYAVIVTNGVCVDTSSCLSVTLTNIDEAALAGDIRLFPNPSSQVAALSLGSAIDQGPVDVAVFSSTGRKVLDLGAVSESELRIDLEDMESGLYFVSVQNATGRKVLRLLKQ